MKTSPCVLQGQKQTRKLFEYTRRTLNIFFEKNDKLCTRQDKYEMCVKEKKFSAMNLALAWRSRDEESRYLKPNILFVHYVSHICKSWSKYIQHIHVSNYKRISAI